MRCATQHAPRRPDPTRYTCGSELRRQTMRLAWACGVSGPASHEHVLLRADGALGRPQWQWGPLAVRAMRLSSRSARGDARRERRAGVFILTASLQPTAARAHLSASARRDDRGP
eukprot:3302531-Prymnesium_polylepis.2